jgi:hypothetical protein
MDIFKRIVRACDYMYYRIAKAYFKWDGKDGITAIFTISFFYCFLTCLPGILIARYFFGQSFLVQYGSIAKLSLIVLALVFLILNFMRYRGKFDILENIYKNEDSRSKTWKGIFVVLALVTPLLAFIFGAIYL